jgi:hypothetical protein
MPNVKFTDADELFVRCRLYGGGLLAPCATLKFTKVSEGIRVPRDCITAVVELSSVKEIRRLTKASAGTPGADWTTVMRVEA